MIGLERITIYPIKSLDGLEVSAARVLAHGPLEFDRRFALVDADGKVINGKRTPLVHQIAAVFADDFARVRLARRGEEGDWFPLAAGDGRLEEWLTDHFGMRVHVIEEAAGGFPDDLAAPGPTVISRQTLFAVAAWFSLSFEEAHRRFRANLVIDAPDSFWEDRLFGPPEGIGFRIGEAEFVGVNPCQRCVVPTRDSGTGRANEKFAKTFRQQREATLPNWAPRTSFNHFYRLAVNTRRAAGSPPATICVGDEVTLMSKAM